MQTGPNSWEPMTEPMRPAGTAVMPASGPYRLEIVRNMRLDEFDGVLVFIGIGQSWDEVRNLNRASHFYTVR